MTNQQRNLSWLILFAMLILSIIGNIILFKMWRGEQRSATEMEGRVSMSEKVIAGLKAEVRTIVLKMRSDSTSSEKRASVHKTVADAASVKRRALRAQISPDSTTQKFAEVAELEIQSLGEIIATKDSAFTLQVKSLYQVISLERLKSSHQQVLISDLGGENQALKREVKKQKRGKFAFKTATGILVVGLAILFSQ